MSASNVKPFVKWVGGKTQLLRNIESKFPYDRNQTFTYVEPFVGGGAVLWWVLNNFPRVNRAIINDANTDLINVYKVVKSDVDELILILQQLEHEYHLLSESIDKRKDYYYTVRKRFNTRESDKVVQAALFIFLNKTCFNGLYRVNKSNEYNVPMGSCKKPTICSKLNLLAAHMLLKKAVIISTDFEYTLEYVVGKPLFYLDPPYKPLSDTANFTAYTTNVFDDDEQVRLKEFCDRLQSLGYKWVLSNSDVRSVDPDNSFFDDLFENYTIDRVTVKRNIAANAKNRGRVTELLITN